MLKHPVFLLALLFAAATAIAGEQLPAQFQAWGTGGPPLPPVPAEWTEARAEPRVPTTPVPTKAEAANGFITFQRRDRLPRSITTLFPPPLTRGQIEAFAAQGRYEPLSFALYALAELRNLRVTATASQTRPAMPSPHRTSISAW